MSSSQIPIDVLIFGGGIAGLWLLDELRRQEYRVLLVENNALGSAQTVGSQGIIHGGLKYMLDGNLNPSAKAISEMPVVWRECLEGKREPDLRGVRLRSDGCYIWGTGSIKSRIFMAGSGIALRAAPQAVARGDWPAALAQVSGKVMKVAEPVVDTVSLVRHFMERNEGHFVLSDAQKAPELVIGTDSGVETVMIPLARGAETLQVAPRTVVLTAGQGNGRLRELAGLSASVMQRRPLHMTMVRGEKLPALFGHCVGGPRPRITVTTAVDSAGRTIWQVGGQIAEDGVNMDLPKLVGHAKSELATCVPGLDLSGAEFSGYRIDRAEAATSTGQKPDDAHLLIERNVMTAFPTKLALAPRLAERVIQSLPRPERRTTSPPGEMPAPRPALPPWETAEIWLR